jgi:hypothetical protein
MKDLTIRRCGGYKVMAKVDVVFGRRPASRILKTAIDMVTWIDLEDLKPRKPPSPNGG